MMILLVSVFGGAVLLMVSILVLVQALVATELEVARQSVLRRQAALSQRDEELGGAREREAALLVQIADLEGSRRDLFNYVVKQEQVLDGFRKNNRPDT